MIILSGISFPSPLLLFLLRSTTLLLCCFLLSQRHGNLCNADIIHATNNSKSNLTNSVAFASGASDNQLLSKLLDIQTMINKETSPFCYNSHSGTKDALKRNNWKKYVGDDLKVIIYPFCLITKELGNKLGNYFTELACARASGVHFIAVHKQFNSTGARQSSVIAAYSSEKLLVDYLPDVWLNPAPLIPYKV